MELDVSKKIRTAIKAKLMELGVHVDEELPDYIMILIANRRSKVQMDEDLSLFLGDNTLKFTNWLHQVLKKLQEVTTTVPPVADSSKAASARVPSETDDSSKKKADEQQQQQPMTTKDRKISSSSDSKDVVDTASKIQDKPKTTEVVWKRRHDDVIESPKTPPVKKLSSSSELEEGTKSPVQKKIKVSRKPIESPVKEAAADKQESVQSQVKLVRKVLSSVVTRKESLEEKKSKEPVKSVIRSRSPVTAPTRSPPPSKRPRSRSPSSRLNRSPASFLRRDRSPTVAETTRTRRDSDRLRSRSPLSVPSGRKTTRRSRSRSASPTSRARRSLRSLVAVVKRHNELNAARDEEYNPAHPEVTPSVASAVHVTPRPKRISKQEGSGSNKLLFRALADAQKSIVSHAIHSKVGANTSDTNERAKSAAEDESSNRDDRRKLDRSKERGKSERNEKYKGNVAGRRVFKPESETAAAKPSIKERLGSRLANRLAAAPTYEEELPPYEDNYEDEWGAGYLAEGQDDYQSIIIKVPTSKDSKQRNVMLEDERKRKIVQQEEPKRLSIQVNVHSDDSSTSEDELEIQPRASEDLNLEPKDATEQTSSKVEKGKTRLRVPEVMDENSKGSSVKSGVSRQDGNDIEPKEVERAESTSKHSEEVEIEEYEEVEEDDEDEYEVVIQESNFTLPDPDEYLKNNGSQEGVSPTENEQSSMEVGESRENVTEAEMDENYIPEPPRYPLNSKSMNHRETMSYAPKFVVTMDGTEDEYNEEMETESYSSEGQFDLRQRIGGARSVLPPRVPQYAPRFNNFNPNARPFLPITGTPRPFLPPSAPAPGSTAPSCKYWPDCSFKDKCIYPHPKCKYGDKCTKAECPYKHERVQQSSVFASGGEAAKADGGNEGKIVCKFFPKCHSMSCQFYHPSPCRFGVGCTDAKCKNFHPGQTVGQSRAKTKQFNAVGGGRGNYRAPPPAAHLLRWKAPSAMPGDMKKDEQVTTTPTASTASA